MSTRLEFHHLTFVEDRDGVTIGRTDIESYAVLPSDGAALLRQLVDGMPVDDAARWYHETFGETVDMADFVDGLRELEFLLADGEAPAEPAPVRLRRLGRAAFSPAGWAVFGAFWLAAVLAMIARPELRPRPSDIFFVPSLVAVQVTLIVLTPVTVLFHEWFHILAGRRLGLPTKLGISRRFYYVVFETQLNGLLGVPKRKRYLPFLAGTIADLLLFAVLTLFALVDHSWPGRLALAVAFTTLLRIVWQCYVFLRTDLYYVIVTMLGCTDLHAATTDYLRRRFAWLPRVRRPVADESVWTPRDRQVAPWFALLTVVGLGALTGTVVLAVIPVLTNFVTRLVSALRHGFGGGAPFWDSLVFLLLLLLELTVAPWLAGRSKKGTS